MSSRCDIYNKLMAMDATIFVGSLLVHQYNISREHPSVLADLATTATMWWSSLAFINDWHGSRGGL